MKDHPDNAKYDGAVKHDQEKPMMELLSPKWLTAVATVLTFGARKYAADNWRKGLKQRRLVGAAMRHLNAYNDGEDLDPESGLSHLAHASCCLMFAFELKITHPELDDRYKLHQHEELVVNAAVIASVQAESDARAQRCEDTKHIFAGMKNKCLCGKREIRPYGS